MKTKIKRFKDVVDVIKNEKSLLIWFEKDKYGDYKLLSKVILEELKNIGINHEALWSEYDGIRKNTERWYKKARKLLQKAEKDKLFIKSLNDRSYISKSLGEIEHLGVDIEKQKIICIHINRENGLCVHFRNLEEFDNDIICLEPHQVLNYNDNSILKKKIKEIKLTKKNNNITISYQLFKTLSKFAVQDKGLLVIGGNINVVDKFINNFKLLNEVIEIRTAEEGKNAIEKAKEKIVIAKMHSPDILNEIEWMKKADKNILSNDVALTLIHIGKDIEEHKRKMTMFVK